MSPRFYYPDTPRIPLPDGHRFPAGKYEMLRGRLLSQKILDEDQLEAAVPATADLLATTHCPAYVQSIIEGTVDTKIMRDIGLPWSETLALRSRSTVGGTLAAARAALSDGISGQLAGGTHHAHFDRGSGFCTFNDFAVAANVLLQDQAVSRVAILDVDVHQGDGNATLLAHRSDVMVVSLHGAKNFPFKKATSDLDIALDDNTDDAAYLAALEMAIEAIARFDPGLILLNAGVDALKDDRLGRLALTHEGLYRRDTMIFEIARQNAWPIMIAIGGGYADPIELTVRAYTNTFAAAKAVYQF